MFRVAEAPPLSNRDHLVIRMIALRHRHVDVALLCNVAREHISLVFHASKKMSTYLGATAGFVSPVIPRAVPQVFAVARRLLVP